MRRLNTAELRVAVPLIFTCKLLALKYGERFSKITSELPAGTRTLAALLIFAPLRYTVTSVILGETRFSAQRAKF